MSEVPLQGAVAGRAGVGSSLILGAHSSEQVTIPDRLVTCPASDAGVGAARGGVGAAPLGRGCCRAMTQLRLVHLGRSPCHAISGRKWTTIRRRRTTRSWLPPCDDQGRPQCFSVDSENARIKRAKDRVWHSTTEAAGCVLLESIPPHVPPLKATDYRGTSLTRKRTTLGPYRRPMPRVLGGS